MKPVILAALALASQVYGLSNIWDSSAGHVVLEGTPFRKLRTLRHKNHTREDRPPGLNTRVPVPRVFCFDRWSRAYRARLETWLRAVEEQEEKEDATSSCAGFLGGVPLSAHMRESWETGRFWLNYAARKSWAFDAVFWNSLDERFFGARGEGVPDEELWKTRVNLLGREEREAMEPFVRRKMEESRERVLVEWEPDEARRRLSELLFDHIA